MVCHGNICRSPMAEFVMKELVKEKGVEEAFEIASAATSAEELGNPVYPPAKKELEKHGVRPSPAKKARRVRKEDFEEYDFLIGMDEENVWNLERMAGNHRDKVYKLLDFTPEGGEVADPWYTRNFEAAYRDIERGCHAFMEYLEKEGKVSCRRH